MSDDRKQILKPLNKNKKSFMQILKNYRTWLCALLLLSPVVHGQVPDRLEAPALQTPAAKQSLLLSITSAGQRLVAVGDQGVILLSDDAGLTWQQAEVPVSTLLTAVYFADEQNGWAVGHDGVVLRTQDAGNHWQLLLQGEQINQLRIAHYEEQLESLQQDPEADPFELEELEFALEDAEFAAEDGPVNPLLNVWFQDTQTGFILGAYGLLMKTADGGHNWQFLTDTLPNPDRYHLNHLIEHQGALFIAGEAGLLLRSDDGGESWYELASPYMGSLFALVEHQDELLLLGLRGNLFRSMDLGDSWQAVMTGSRASLLSGRSAEGRLLLVGLGGTLLSGPGSQNLQLLDGGQRRALSGVVMADDHWVLVSEQGPMRLPLEGVN